MHEIIVSGDWLPLVFAFLMGLSMLIYALLDGYDLGVGILMKYPDTLEVEQDRMIASIGPFWDANETWLVLGVGLLLVAFPEANGIILGKLYIPVALMLIGLVLRGVAFDFRAKAKVKFKQRWNTIFFAGSLITALSQGYMLGSYILGFEKSFTAIAFSILTGLCVAAGYCLIGACWLIYKMEHDLQKKAVRWAFISLWVTTIGIGLVSLATPYASPRIFEKWFSFPNFLLLALVPAITGILILVQAYLLRHTPRPKDQYAWLPFVVTAMIFILCFLGLAYSFYPYIVPDQLKIVDATSAPDSLKFILVGALVVLPAIITYTIFAHYVFRGKAEDLSYH